MQIGRASTFVWLSFPTGEGEFVAQYSTHGLAALRFPSKQSVISENSGEISAAVRRWHRLTTAAVKAILAGRAPAELPPLDLSAGTKFQQSVWAGMGEIKFGQTQSYGELAVTIGNPKAVRAVGGACGANPIPVLVPCHRVLAAQKKLGGFSSGLDWKKKLLACEGVRFS